MALLRAIRFFRGYRAFEVQGGRPERFINLCVQGGVPLWDQRCGEGVFSAATSADCARLLPDYAARCGMRLTLGPPRGACAVFGRFGKRRGLLLGAALTLFLLFALGRFIWTVEINGLETISPAEVYAALEEFGVKKGTLRSAIRVKETERRLLLRFDALAFAAVNLDGTVATIELSERTLPPTPVNDDIPHNVVAAQSGYITRIEVYTGFPLVKAGDSVSAGDVLISGIMDDAKGTSRLVHARGRVTAQTARTLAVTAPYSRELLFPDGVQTRRYLNIMGERLPLWFYRAPDCPTDTETQVQDIPLLTALSGLTLCTERVTLYRTETLRLSVPEAMAAAERLLAEAEGTELGEMRILSRQKTGQELAEGFLLSCDYICEGEIAEESEIFIENS